MSPKARAKAKAPKKNLFHRTKSTAKKKPAKKQAKKPVAEAVVEEATPVETPATKVSPVEPATKSKPDEAPAKKKFSLLRGGDPKKPKKEKGAKRGLFRKKTAEEQAEASADVDSTAFLIEVREQERKSGLAGFLTSLNYMGMGKYRHMFVQSISTMLGAGLPVLDSLEAFQMEVKSKPVKKMVGQILLSVQNGSSLWRAMDDTYFFTPYEIAMVHIGEDAGNLARNLQYLAEQQEKDRALKQKVKMAMIYPTIVLSMLFIIVMGLGIFILPNLVQVLFSLNVELPLTTRIVIQVTGWFEAYGLQATPIMIVGVITLALLSKYTRFKAVTQWFIFRLPGIGTLAREATIARFGVITGGLLRAGVPIVDALESLADVTQVYAYRKFYFNLVHRIKVGDSFSKSFKLIRATKKLLPPSVQQLIITGERSGKLSDTLLKVSEIYEKKAEETAEKLPIILEPMLLLFIGALVGTIAFAIIVPIYGVVGNVGRA